MRAYYDIETGGLSPRKDPILVVSYVTDDGGPVTRTIIEEGESAMIVQLRDALSDFSEVVSWNGWRFDKPFINYRSARHGLSRWQPPLHTDLGIVTKNRYGLRLWSQARIMQHFGLEPNPYPFDDLQWAYAKSGDPEGIKYVSNHCEFDVVSLRALYGLLMLGDNHVE